MERKKIERRRERDRKTEKDAQTQRHRLKVPAGLLNPTPLTHLFQIRVAS
jgi:hypothetical protein